jgi:hypothetical protein
METPGDEPAIVFAEAAVRDRLRRVDQRHTTADRPTVSDRPLLAGRCIDITAI